MMITLDQPASHPTHCHHLAGRDGDEGNFTTVPLICQSGTRLKLSGFTPSSAAKAAHQNRSRAILAIPAPFLADPTI